MSDNKDLKAFLKPNPEAYKRYQKIQRKKKVNGFFVKFKKIANVLSRIILWICAVGGFVLSLIQFFQN